MDTSLPINASQLYRKVQPPEIEKNHPRDVAFYELHDTRAWKYLKEQINQYIEHLENTLNITEHDSVTDVGYKYLAASVAKQYLIDLRNSIETSYSVVKESE
jgi:hypothetical protein